MVSVLETKDQLFQTHIGKWCQKNMGDTHSNTPYLFNTCSGEPEKPVNHIEVLVLTDEETANVKQERKRRRKENKAFQIECKDFFCRTWYKVLNEKNELAKKKGLPDRNGTWFMSDGHYQGMFQKIRHIFYDEYGFYPEDVLKGNTQSWVNQDEIYKRRQDYKKRQQIPADLLKKQRVLSGDTKRFKKFFTQDGKLILDTPKEKLSIRERDLKKNYKFNKEFLETVEEATQELEREKIRHQDPKKYKSKGIKNVQNILYGKFKVRRGIVNEAEEALKAEKRMKILEHYDFMGALDDWEIGLNEDRLDRINPKWKVSDEQQWWVNKYLGITESEVFSDDVRGDLD